MLRSGKKRTQGNLEQPPLRAAQYTRDQRTFDAARRQLFGDPSYEQAAEKYRKAYEEVVLRRYPQLAGYLHRKYVSESGYRYQMSRINALSADISALEDAPSRESVNSR